jgi:DNA-binding NtrC family response regulator
MTSLKPAVLIVDDERNLRRLLTHAMTVEGYQVETASNGNACLGFCQQRSDSALIGDG